MANHALSCLNTDQSARNPVRWEEHRFSCHDSVSMFKMQKCSYVPSDPWHLPISEARASYSLYLSLSSCVSVSPSLCLSSSPNIKNSWFGCRLHIVQRNIQLRYCALIIRNCICTRALMVIQVTVCRTFFYHRSELAPTSRNQIWQKA